MSYVVCHHCRMSHVSSMLCLLCAPPKKNYSLFLIPLFLIPLFPIPYIPSLIPHPSSLISTFYSSFFIPYFVFLFHILSIYPDHFLQPLGICFQFNIISLFFFTTINTFSNFIPTSNNSLFFYFVFRISDLFIHSFCPSVPPFTLSFVRYFDCLFFVFFSFIVSFTCSVVSS